MGVKNDAIVELQVVKLKIRFYYTVMLDLLLTTLIVNYYLNEKPVMFPLSYLGSFIGFYIRDSTYFGSYKLRELRYFEVINAQQ